MFSNAGIDIGKREMTVTMLTGAADAEPVQPTKTFGTTVPELHRGREWLLAAGCATVVLESTGTYWVPVWNVLHEARTRSGRAESLAFSRCPRKKLNR